MMFPHEPHNGRYITHALVIRNNDERAVFLNVVWITKSKSSAQEIKASHNAKLKGINTYFMCLITKNIETKPLYGMKDKQSQSKKQEVNNW